MVNVEKGAKRTRAFVKKRDLFGTKEVEDTGAEKADFVEEEMAAVEVMEEIQQANPSPEPTQPLDPTTTSPIITNHTIARKPLPIAAAPDPIEEIPPQQQQKDDLEITTNDTPPISAPSPSETDPVRNLAEPAATEPHLSGSKKQTPIFSQLNKKFHGLTFKKEEKETTTIVSITEIACEGVEGADVVDDDDDGGVGVARII